MRHHIKTSISTNYETWYRNMYFYQLRDMTLEHRYFCQLPCVLHHVRYAANFNKGALIMDSNFLLPVDGLVKILYLLRTWKWALMSERLKTTSMEWQTKSRGSWFKIWSSPQQTGVTGHASSFRQSYYLHEIQTVPLPCSDPDTCCPKVMSFYVFPVVVSVLPVRACSTPTTLFVSAVRA